MLNGHGDDGYLYHNIAADFSTNVWYGGPPEGLKAALFNNWDKISHYPEVAAESLARKIENHHTLQAGQVLVANGTTESIYLVAQAFKGKNTMVVTPSFAEYEDACKMYDHHIDFLDWSRLSAYLPTYVDAVFIGNPNNPTGAVFYELEPLIAGNPQTVFVIDEAFIEFTVAISSVINLTQKFANLIVLRSMTKAYAIPGLRLGYIVAGKKLIDKLSALKQPWSVNTLAIEAGHFIFDNYTTLTLPLAQLLNDKAAFADQIKNLGFKVWHSDTQFFLAETPGRPAAELKEYLLGNYNLLIRNAYNFRGLNQNCFRVATQRPAQNQLLIKALSKWQTR